jgi:archaellum component FlaC
MQRNTELKITSMLITLENINDNLRRANEVLENISLRIGALESKSEMTMKHIISFRDEESEVSE